MTDTSHVERLLQVRDDNARPLLDSIGRSIGYGNSCRILGELWDEYLAEGGYPRGRGKMENRPDVELAEAQKRRADEAEAKLAACEAEHRRIYEAEAAQITAPLLRQIEQLRALLRECRPHAYGHLAHRIDRALADGDRQ